MTLNVVKVIWFQSQNLWNATSYWNHNVVPADKHEESNGIIHTGELKQWAPNEYQSELSIELI